MKILKVILHNIHSLKGTFIIPFSEGVLADAGLFAITGQTGAGKSTILDAITLSLYGQTNRHGNSKSEEEIITRNEREAFTETTFEINNEVYCARWAVSYTRNNTLKGNAAERRLVHIQLDNDVLVADKITTVQSAILNIVGLNFEQFTKSVLLAQNNFSAFLKANPRERAEMLSKITGTQIYEEISKAVFEKTKLLKDELDLLKSKLSVDLLSALEIEDLNIKLEQQKEQIFTINTSVIEYQSQIKTWENYSLLQKDIQESTSKLAEIQVEIDNNKSNYDLLNQYEKALKIQNELFEFENLEKEIELLNQNIDATDQTLQNIANKVLTLNDSENEAKLLVEKSETQLNLQIPKIETAKQIFVQSEAIQKSVLEVESNIQLKKSEFLSLEGELKKIDFTLKQEQDKKVILIEKQTILQPFLKWEEARGVVGNFYNQIKNTEFEIAKISISNIIDEIKELELKLQLLKPKKETALSECQLHENKLVGLINKQAELSNLEILSAEKEKLSLTISSFNEFKNLTISLNKLEEIFNSNKLIISDLEFKKEQVFVEVNKQKELCDLLKQNALLSAKLASLEQHRHELINGEPCPLCGALEHPFSENNPSFQNDLNEKLILEENKYQLILEQKNNIEKELIKLISDNENIHNQVNELNVKRSEVKEKFDIKNDLQIHEIEQYLFEAGQLLEINYLKIRELNELNSEILVLNKTIAESKEVINKMVLNETDLIAELHLKQQTLSSSNAQIEEKKIAVNVAYEEILNIFQLFNIDLPEKTLQTVADIGKKLTDNFEELKGLNNDLQALTESIASLDKSKASLVSKLENVNVILADLRKNKELFSEEINQFSKELKVLTNDFQLKNPSSEEQRLRLEFDGFKNKMNEIHSELAKITVLESTNKLSLANNKSELVDKIACKELALKQLNLSLLDNQFENIESLKNVMKLTNVDQLKQQKSQHEKLFENYNGVIKSANEKLEKIYISGLPNINYEELTSKLKVLEEQKTQLNQNVGSVIEQLRKDKLEKEQQTSQLEIINSKEEKYQYWAQLNTLIGSKSGDNFKKFAQDFTLSLLVQHANKHLSVMFNRYELVKDENSEEMELQIKDKHFFNDLRNINSLSGGETFLVSLSLALGLSDLASKNTKIRSLFIDEGFGSLDPENLNKALDTLELLRQTDDRQIGIISHVEELKKRIHTQIQVNKISAEFSNIQIVDC